MLHTIVTKYLIFIRIYLVKHTETLKRCRKLKRILENR